jgi:UDPglucose 6-dehydrogenase
VNARLSVVGAGRTGAITAACLADLGHSVCAVDVDADLVAKLQQGTAHFFEPNLDDLLKRGLEAGRLSFTTAYSDAIPDAAFILLCVDTPSRSNGEADLSSLEAAIQELAPLLANNAIVITRSTVPVGTNASLADAIRAKNPDATFQVVSNPEFLREGQAVDDFMRPDRIVLGANVEAAARSVAGLYEGVKAPIILADLPTAELIKYAANAFLATSISFINEIANICGRAGADVSLVSQALALDRRIGPHAYLAPGIGFGGSCLPKDMSALIHTAQRYDYDPLMLKTINKVNELQPRRIITYLEEVFKDVAGLTVAVLGISFKGDTFDTRSSPAVAVIRLLAQEGIQVRAFDPLADDTAEDLVGDVAELCSDAYSAAESSDALVIATEHSEFRELNLERIRRSMRSGVLIDGRNLLDPELASRAGFSYVGIGRPRRDD